MIITGDTETQGLSGNMIECCFYKSKNKKYICKNKKEVWSVLTTLAEKESKRGHNLFVYFHNASFDFYKIIDWSIKGIKIKNNMPFIAEYSEDYELSKKPDKKFSIIFLDTWGIYRMSLKRVAELIGDKKLDISNELLDECGDKKSLTPEERKYMIKDAEICYNSITRIKQELKKYDTSVKTIISIGQVAMNCFLNWCKKEGFEEIFEDRFRNLLIQSKYAKEIHKAYRYGRIEVERTTESKGVYEVDINNLYSFSAMNNPFPDLRSERKLTKPLDVLSKKGFKKLLKQYPIGITKGIIKTPNKNLEYGFLVNKIDNKLYFPNKRNKYMIGAWTNIELLKAIELGYKIIGVEYTITFNESKENPFERYFKEIYLRRGEKGTFSNYFWKQVANFTIGKFAQKRPKREYILDSIMKAEEYYKKGFKFVKSYKENYLYEKKYPEEPSKQYNPILPAMINAYAKIYHYHYLTQIPRKDFVYCDTDNIIFKNEDNLKKFPISNKIGDFKIAKKDASFKAWNRKSYRIGDEIRMSGVRKPQTPEQKKEMIRDFDNGIIHYNRMIGINRGQPLENAGQFEKVSANLFDSMADKIVKEDDMSNRDIYMNDNDSFDMEYIKECIKKDKTY